MRQQHGERAVAEKRDAGGADEAEVAVEAGCGDLRGGQSNCQTGLRTDQASTRLPESEGGMDSVVRDTQTSEDVLRLPGTNVRRKVLTEREKDGPPQSR